MVRSMNQIKRILEYRERKAHQLKRPVSFSEAVALWLSESFNNTPQKSKKKRTENLFSDFYTY